MPLFYPDPAFGWTFYAVLFCFLVAATYVDIRSLKIPKKLTLTMLAVGLVFGVVRGAWMGSLLDGRDEAVWLFGSSPVTGALDGLLCALAGFVVCLLVGTALYVLGIHGGGDVKLMAALGAWVGATKQLPMLLLAIMVVYLLLGVVLMLRKVFRRGVQKAVFGVKPGAAGNNLKKTPAGMYRREQVLTYSLPVAVAAGLLLPFYVLHDQRHPVPPKDAPPREQVSARQ
jgi:Flp pilus assembly protein protease CpaA